MSTDKDEIQKQLKLMSDMLRELREEVQLIINKECDKGDKNE